MNKKAIYITSGIIAIGIVGFFVIQGIKNRPSVNIEEQLKANTITTYKSSIKTLLNTTYQPQKCFFSDPELEGTMSGTLFVVNGKMRGEFSVLVSGKTVYSHMIIQNNTITLWTDGMPRGFKMQLSETEKPENQGKVINANREYDYVCEEWQEDPTMFNTPKNITFGNVNSMPSNTAQEGETINETELHNAKCAICDKLPESSKNQCRASFNCK